MPAHEALRSAAWPFFITLAVGYAAVAGVVLAVCWREWRARRRER